MQKLIVGIVIGSVIGILFGASVVAPRLIAVDGEKGPQRTLDSEFADSGVNLPDGRIVETTNPNDKNRLAAPSEDGDGTFHWELASAFPSDLALFGDLPRRLEKQINILSVGKNSIRFNEPDTLAPAQELMEAVRSGAVDVAFTAPILSAEQIPALGLFGGAPFGATATELLAWIYSGGGMEVMDKIYHKRDLHSLPCGLLSAEPAGWFNKKILSTKDWNGLRMRVDGLGARVVEKLGVEVFSMPPQSVSQAFELGHIDAAELSLPSIDLGLGLHNVVDYYYFPGWHQRSTLLVLMMRLETWQSLRPNHQGYLLSICGDNIRQGLAEGEATQLEALKIINGSGVEILRFPQGVITALSDAWQATARELGEQDEEFARTWYSLQRFRRDFDIWFDLNQLEYGDNG